jgi:hypothetical protein
MTSAAGDGGRTCPLLLSPQNLAAGPTPASATASLSSWWQHSRCLCLWGILAGACDEGPACVPPTGPPLPPAAAAAALKDGASQTPATSTTHGSHNLLHHQAEVQGLPAISTPWGGECSSIRQQQQPHMQVPRRVAERADISSSTLVTQPCSWAAVEVMHTMSDGVVDGQPHWPRRAGRTRIPVTVLHQVGSTRATGARHGT